MDRSFGRTSKDLETQNIYFGNLATSCPSSTIKTNTLEACSVISNGGVALSIIECDQGISTSTNGILTLLGEGGILTTCENPVHILNQRYLSKYVVGNDESEYNTVQAAINAALANPSALGVDVIIVRPGNYPGFTLPSGIFVIGVGLLSVITGTVTVNAQNAYMTDLFIAAPQGQDCLTLTPNSTIEVKSCNIEVGDAAAIRLGLNSQLRLWDSSIVVNSASTSGSCVDTSVGGSFLGFTSTYRASGVGTHILTGNASPGLGNIISFNSSSFEGGDVGVTQDGSYIFQAVTSQSTFNIQTTGGGQCIAQSCGLNAVNVITTGSPGILIGCTSNGTFTQTGGVFVLQSSLWSGSMTKTAGALNLLNCGIFGTVTSNGGGLVATASHLLSVLTITGAATMSAETCGFRGGITQTGTGTIQITASRINNSLQSGGTATCTVTQCDISGSGLNSAIILAGSAICNLINSTLSSVTNVVLNPIGTTLNVPSSSDSNVILSGVAPSNPPVLTFATF